MDYKERNTYRAVVISNTLQTSKEKGTPSVKIKVKTQFNILEPNIAIDYTLYGDLWLTFKALKKTLKTLLEVFNWKGKFIEDLNKPILTGIECDVVVDEGDYNGKPTFDIQFFNRPGGLREMVTEDLQNLINEVQPMIDKEMGNRGEEVKKASDQDMIASDENSQAISVENVVDEDLPF